MNTWVLGERRNIYTQVSAAIGEDPTISDAVYEIFDTSDDSVVASGDAIVYDLIVYFLWEPSVTGVYVAKINYTVGSELYNSSQVIDVKETM
jgi:hypothetical protein